MMPVDAAGGADEELAKHARPFDFWMCRCPACSCSPVNPYHPVRPRPRFFNNLDVVQVDHTHHLLHLALSWAEAPAGVRLGKEEGEVTR
ncbi:hypothetical protein BaRGS_00025084 [Batillaria attramentaria]|uniref:Uncharacterized protein n=1 Tax=Batillaria attramentaria TaxID=370345 RepID=A0ABD0K9N9_9CAEN